MSPIPDWMLSPPCFDHPEVRLVLTPAGYVRDPKSPLDGLVDAFRLLQQVIRECEQ